MSNETEQLLPGAAQVAEYERRGFALVRGLFAPAEVAAWAEESARLLRLCFAREGEARGVTYRTAAGLAVVDHLSPVIDVSPIFAALAADSRLTGVLGRFSGRPVSLFKDKLIYKMPGLPGYPLHQDYSSWQEFPRELISAVVAIDGADAENGGVEFFPGYHDRLLSAPGELRHMNAEEARQVDAGGGGVVRTEPGDLIVFHCLTPHRSGVNRSDRLRRQLYFTYSPAAHGDLYEAQLKFAARWRERAAARRAAAEAARR
jgi:2-aminoethylphosphonate dioxygenase